jgi:hypothetical protein
LERRQCPTPFHTVRTRFFGDIASPDLQVSPMKSVAALWGGTLSVFESDETLNELIGALVMGLWNRLSSHQERSALFRLTRIEVPATHDGMATLAPMRREELDGFTEGLIGDNESLDLPERAQRAIKLLAEMRAMLACVRELAENPGKPAAPAGIAITLGQLRELTRIAEHEMHEAVLSCTRARRQMFRMMPAARPMLHCSAVPPAAVRTRIMRMPNASVPHQGPCRMNPVASCPVASCPDAAAWA